MGQGLETGYLRGLQHPGGQLDEVAAVGPPEAAAEPGHRPGIEPNLGVDVVGYRDLQRFGLSDDPGQHGIGIVHNAALLEPNDKQYCTTNRRKSHH